MERGQLVGLGMMEKRMGKREGKYAGWGAGKKWEEAHSC